MIITETQSSGIIRTYNLPDHQRESWHDFFDWLVRQGYIESWEELNF